MIQSPQAKYTKIHFCLLISHDISMHSKDLEYLSLMIMCFLFWGLPDVISSLFLFWLLIELGLGGGDGPFNISVSRFSTVTTGERGKGTLLAGNEVTLVELTSTRET